MFEGADAVGKTTLANRLKQRAQLQGAPCEQLSFPGREGGSLGDHIYKLYHNHGRFSIKSISPISMQVLVTAAHIEVIESRVRPALEAGKTVILDRYWWSTWVYGSVHGVVPDRLQAIVDLELLCWGSIAPELILLIDRSQPLRHSENMITWQRLVAEYRCLAETQATTAPVRVVRNDGPLSDAIREITVAAVAAGILDSVDLREGV